MFQFAYVGAAHMVGGVAAITLSADFDSPTGGTPQTTASRTTTVPTGNPGSIFIDITASSGSPALTCSIDAGAFNALVDGDAISGLTTGSGLRFRVTGASSSVTVQLYDNATVTPVGTPFTITCT